MSNSQLPKYWGAKGYYISPEGLQHLLSRNTDTEYPNRHVTWTDDFRAELPIKLGNEGVSAVHPTTLID